METDLAERSSLCVYSMSVASCSLPATLSTRRPHREPGLLLEQRSWASQLTRSYGGYVW